MKKTETMLNKNITTEPTNDLQKNLKNKIKQNSCVVVIIMIIIMRTRFKKSDYAYGHTLVYSHIEIHSFYTQNKRYIQLTRINLL